MSDNGAVELAEARRLIAEQRRADLDAAGREIAAICERYGVTLRVGLSIVEGRIVGQVELVYAGGP